jgi:HD superfamily phosphohydrolase
MEEYIIGLEDEPVIIPLKQKKKLKLNNMHKTDGNYIKDPIHGDIEISRLCKLFMDTPEFQRLRYLKQLGHTYLVYPSANNKRFEHSVGVSYLAKKQLRHLRKTQPELKITRKDIELVGIAGLYHDVGHGSYSHSFEKQLKKMGIKFNHEKMSVDIIHRVCERLGLSLEDANFITSLIVHDFDDIPQEKKYLYQIVCNEKSGLDVDKYDYLLRDSYYCHVNLNIDPAKIIHNSKVINGELCYNQKMYYNIYQIYYARYSMFKQVYLHKTCGSFELMFQDYFDNLHLDVQKIISNLDEYLKLTDNIYPQYYNDNLTSIVHNIQSRNIYKLMYEYVVPSDLDIDDLVNEFNIYISEKFNEKEYILDNIKVNKLKISFGMNNDNPVDYVKFYSKHDLNTSFRIDKNTVSGVFPDNFCEKLIRVYYFNTPIKTVKNYDAVKTAVTDFFMYL